MTIRDTMEGLNQIADHFGHAADVLHNRANLAESEAAKVELGGDMNHGLELRDKAQRFREERTHRLKLLDFARAAILHLKPKAKRAGFQPPTKGEVLAYASQVGLPIPEVDAFYDYYESKGWRVGTVRMSNWQASMRNWKRRSEKPKDGRPADAPTEPEGWSEFRDKWQRERRTPAITKPEFKYAPSRAVEAFKEWRKRK